MTNHRFISILVTVFLLFSAILGGTGCGGGHSSFLNKPENENVDEPNEPTPDMFTVTFDSNGGSKVTSIEVTSGSTIEAPAAPTKEGYIFAGWYKDNTTFNEPFIFGSNGEKITQDITLYAQWVDPDALTAEYALSEIVISYAAGDNPKYVTRDLTLPTKIGSADISWTSNSGAVSSNGTVTRQEADMEVTLTSTASYKGKSDTRIFNIKVIKKRTRVNSDITPLTLNEAKSGDITVEQNASGDVTGIEGQYVSFDINNADDALDAITFIRNELRIKEPANELEIFRVTSDKYGAKYQFQQVHNGIKVWGCAVTVSTNSAGKANFLYSFLLSSDIVAKADGKNDIGQSTAESNAKAAYTGNITVDATRTEKVIYSLNEYQAAPVYAYIVNVSGTNTGGTYIDEDVFINANTGTLIDSFTNIHENSLHRVKIINVKDELNKTVSFDVLLVEYNGTISHVMTGNVPCVQMFLGNLDTPIIHDINKKWDDGQSISAYINACNVVNWWKEHFQRDSLDGNGNMVKIVTHAGKAFNASWFGGRYEALVIYDMPDDDVDNYYSFAVGVDILVHESTHAINDYDIPGKLQYKNQTGAIDEAYADIFGCIKDEDWYLGETICKLSSNLKCLRDISNPDANYAFQTAKNHAPHNLKERRLYTTDPDYPLPDKDGNDQGDHGGVHDNSYIISRTAYLMHEDYIEGGLTWEELGEVWYKSIQMGILCSKAGFSHVRLAVVNAAKEMSLSPIKIAAIEKAFEKVGIAAIQFMPPKTLPTPNNPSNPEEPDNPDTPTPTVDVPIDEAHFPDAGFRTYINDKIDSNKDSILNKTEIQDTTKIDVGFWNYTIHLLQGIEYFTNLKELHCNSQSLTSLDLSKNTALQVLGCNGNQLTMLNVSGCNMLKEIHCDGDLNSNTYGNRLTKLDVSSCTALEYLSCRGNKLTELDVSKNIALKNLLCDVNQLTFLDVRKNTALQGLVCDHNQLAELDVSKNNDLQRLDCSYNKLVILDISKNVKLQKLTCWNNQLTVLDVSGCSSLEQIYCSHNQLIELDLAENTALQELSCRDNQLIELKNISDCTALRTLDCWNNQLTELDLTKNVVLSKLECRYNQLTVLDVSHCYQYINVYCDNNVIVTYPPSRTTSLSTANSNALEDTSIIVANLPTFIAGTTGEYSFNVSLDKIVSAESTLIFKNASENLFGVFLDENGEEITMPTTTSLDRVKVSALFDAGVTYSPVIIAQSDESLNNSGGCNGEACGIFTLSLLCLIAKKVQHKHNKKRR